VPLGLATSWESLRIWELNDDAVCELWAVEPLFFVVVVSEQPLLASKCHQSLVCHVLSSQQYFGRQKGERGKTFGNVTKERLGAVS
jgi:hypothetical protein